VRLHDLNPGCPVCWLEVGLTRDRGLPVASENVIGKWREEGVEVETASVPGDAFWRNAESRVNPDLQRRTTEMLGS
jgi:hypothetical protein